MYGDCSHEIQRRLLLGRKAMTNLDNLLKSSDIALLTKTHIWSSYCLPSGHVWLWELDLKEGRMLKNWCLQTIVLEKTESPLDSKEIKSVNLKGNQSWILIGRIHAEVETPVFWPSDMNSLLPEKVPDAGKDCGQKEKRESEDEIAGWHH